MTPSEIVGQIMVARDRLGDWPGTVAEDLRGIPDTMRKITNVVLMGMGEPLYNFDNVTRRHGHRCRRRGPVALQAPHHAVDLRRRAGDPALGRRDGTMLAISLHAVRDELRDQLVPINKK